MTDREHIPAGRQGRHRYLFAGLAAALGVYLSWSLAHQVASARERLITLDFEDDALHRFYAVANHFESCSMFLSDLRALHVASAEVEREEFGKFGRFVVSRHFARQSGTQAIEWAPRILTHLVDRVSTHDPLLGRQLGRLAASYDYPALLDLLPLPLSTL